MRQRDAGKLPADGFFWVLTTVQGLHRPLVTVWPMSL